MYVCLYVGETGGRLTAGCRALVPCPPPPCDCNTYNEGRPPCRSAPPLRRPPPYFDISRALPSLSLLLLPVPSLSRPVSVCGRSVALCAALCCLVRSSPPMTTTLQSKGGRRRSVPAPAASPSLPAPATGAARPPERRAAPARVDSFALCQGLPLSEYVSVGFVFNLFHSINATNDRFLSIF